jgi:hypothetical protein
MECQYCHKMLSTLSSLNLHQKRTKYCLKLQGVDTKGDFKCKCCDDTFTLKSSLDKHLLSCKKNTLYIQELHKTITDQTNNIILLQHTIQLLEKDKSNLQDSYAELAQISVNRNFEEEAVIEMEIDENEEKDEEKDEEYQLTPLEVGKDLTIEHREEDGYINVTNLCKAGGKQFKHWKSLEKTKAFTRVLSSAVGIPTAELIKLGTGSKYENSHTWVHPQVAINIAQWISPQFDVKVSAWVYEVMMTGRVDITATKSYRQIQAENQNKDIKIKQLTKKYVKAQPRVQYKERNVVYILTTRLLKTERRYILGKATNLTSRLSTYNKSDEHEVVYYQECPDEETVGIVETMIFQKLKNYREQANRERFVLPENVEIELFISTIKKCIELF